MWTTQIKWMTYIQFMQIKISNQIHSHFWTSNIRFGHREATDLLAVMPLGYTLCHHGWHNHFTWVITAILCSHVMVGWWQFFWKGLFSHTVNGYRDIKNTFSFTEKCCCSMKQSFSQKIQGFDGPFLDNFTCITHPCLPSTVRMFNMDNFSSKELLYNLLF